MASVLPPVVASLLADTQEFSAKMDEATGQLEAFGGASDAAGGRFSGFVSKASTAIIGLGAAIGGYALDKAYKFQEGLDDIKNQSSATEGQVKQLGNAILDISGKTTSSISDLTSAGLAVYQAGIKGSAAIKLLSNAAKAATITGENVTGVTQDLITVEGLHFAKSKDIAKVTGELVAGSKDYVGGLDAESSVLSGKVGVALKNYGLSLKTSIGLGAVFNRVGLPTRSVASFVNGLGKLVAPLTTVSDSTGKLETGFSSYYENLKQVGLSQVELAKDLRDGNIAGLLDQITDAAQRSHQPLSELMNVVFGSSAGGVASLLSKSGGTIEEVQKQLAGSGSQSLTAGFDQAMQQMPNKIKNLLNNVEVDFTKLGEHLLPAAADVLGWIDDFAKDLQNDPILRDVLGGGAATLFAAALAVKLKSVVSGIMGIFNKSKTQVQNTQQVNYLAEIANNTERTATNTQRGAAAEETEDTETETTNAELTGVEGEGAVGAGAGTGADLALAGGGVASKFGGYVAVFGAGVAAFELTSAALKTSLGKKVGDVLTAGGNWNPINQLASAIGNLTGKIDHPTPNKYEAKDLKIIAEHKKPKTTLKASVKIH